MQQNGTNNTAGWKGVHKDVDTPEEGGGAPREMFALVAVLLLCLYTDHVVQEKLCSAGCPGPLGAQGPVAEWPT